MQQELIQDPVITTTNNTNDSLQEVDIQEIINLIEQGYTAEILYSPPTSRKRDDRSTITLICNNLVCYSVREVKPVFTNHSGSELLIRWKDEDKTINHSKSIYWREYYISNTVMNMSFRINLDQLQEESNG
tara:strand:- start:208 stop:600 length:393 start_codon:yes stop_codon:yes gene_type:complete